MNTGNVIISRFPVKSANTYLYGTTGDWQFWMPNGIVHAEIIVLDDVSVNLFSTHMHSDSKPGEHWMNNCARPTRKKQMIEFRNYVRQIPGNYIYSGDWNVPGGQDEYRVLRKTMGTPGLMEVLNFPITTNPNSFLAPPGWRDKSKCYLKNYPSKEPLLNERGEQIMRLEDCPNPEECEFVLGALTLCLDHIFTNMSVPNMQMGTTDDGRVVTAPHVKVLTDWDISDHYGVEFAVEARSYNSQKGQGSTRAPSQI